MKPTIATGTFTVGFAPDAIPQPTPTRMGVWNDKVNYIRDAFTAPYVEHEGAAYLRISDGNCIGINPKTDVANQSLYWQHNEILDLIWARKIEADEINTENLVVKQLKSATEGRRVEIFGSEIKVFGDFAMNIQLGVDDSGMAVLKYFNNDGKMLYNLGPRGIDWGSIQPASWSTLKLTSVVLNPANDNLPDWYDVSDVMIGLAGESSKTYYKYFAGSNPEITPEEKEKEKYLYTSNSTTSAKIADGWYCLAWNGSYAEYYSSNTGQYIRPDGDKGIYDSLSGVVDLSPIYVVKITLYRGGIAKSTANVYWSGAKPK
ncbi:MAG: hypothetical protein ACRCX5_02135 [Bacteroidales bacterium]